MKRLRMTAWPTMGVVFATSFLFSVGSLDDVNRLDNTQLSNLLGDVNQSGSVTAIDATITLQYVVGAAQLTDAQVNLADVSGNGTVSSLDASLILRRVVDTNYRFPRQDMSYPLAVTIQGEGSVDEAVISTKSEYQYGTAVRLIARADEGWKFSGWSGDISGTDTSVTITVDVAKNVTATFEEARMKLNLTKTGSGEVGVAPEKEYYMPGDSLQLIANPDYGYRFLSWTYGDSTYQNDTVNVVVGTTLDIGVEFEYGEWVSKAFPMDGVNATSEMYFQNSLSPGFYETNESSLQKGYHILNYDKYCMNPDTGICDCNSICYEADYRFWDASKMHLDLNGDGLLDMFSFLTDFKGGGAYAKYEGKALIVLDVLGPNPEMKISEIENRWMPKIYLTDIEGDGRVELFLGGEEDHGLSDGTRGDPRPIRYLKFSDDGSFEHNYFGPNTAYHDLAMGDIDNDGDIDILISGQQTENSSFEDPSIFSRLFLYENEDGNFVYANQNQIFANYFEALGGNDWRYRQTWAALDLFDLDGDGWLDIVGGDAYNDNIENNHPMPKIVWNQGDGSYNMNDVYKLPHRIDFSQFTDPHPLGFNAFDYNNDGLLDLVTAITPDYGGYIIQIHKNLGDRTFEDVTQEIVVGYQDTYTRGQCTDGTAENDYLDGDPSNFYNIRPIDKDGDGDYDLVPDNWATWDCEFNQNIFWENRNGKFYRSY